MNTSPAPDPKLVKRTNEIAGKIHSMLPKGFGFIVMIFPFGTGESDEPVMNYASNARQEDVLGVLREFIARTAKEFGKKL